MSYYTQKSGAVTGFGIFLFCFQIISAQVQFSGQCPPVEVVNSFDLQQYLGVWYEIQKYPTYFEGPGKCNFAVYSDNGNGTIRVRNAAIGINSTGVFSDIVGSARLVDPEGGKAKLAVTFPTAPGNREAPYWVIDTDYTSRAIVWNCAEIENNNIQFLWYLSRVRNPDDQERKYVKDFIENAKIDYSSVVGTDQSKCPNTYAIV